MPVKILPSLDQLLSIDKIPEELSSLRDVIENIFEDIYVKDVLIGQNHRGDEGTYTLTLVIYNSVVSVY